MALGKDVLPDDPPVGGTHGPGGLDVLEALHLEHPAPEDAQQTWPAQERDGHQHVPLVAPRGGGDDRQHDDCPHQVRERIEAVGQPGDHRVDPAAVVPGDPAQGHPDEHGKHRGAQRDHHRDPGAMGDLGVVVAPLDVGAEPVIARRRKPAVAQVAERAGRVVNPGGWPHEQLGDDSHGREQRDQRGGEPEQLFGPQDPPGVAPVGPPLGCQNIVAVCSRSDQAWRQLLVGFPSRSSSVIADPRIEQGVQKVDHQVDDEIGQDQHDRDADDDGVVALGYRTCDGEATPGMLKIDSVTIVPPSNAPSWMPTTVMTGIRAGRTAWIPNTLRSAGPLRSGCADIVLAHSLDHRGPHQPQVGCHDGEGHDERR